ncbi:hypothetical protein RX331_07500 [Bradyrhizobium sp. BWA-3-5]|nr:hypothetical protein [Bradyrhizobium sp. BWA-3-5]WOH67587.1 hypothetical protein RX331_07500 [Bradyrhizobium sp. BWA-3-5]
MGKLSSRQLLHQGQTETLPSQVRPDVQIVNMQVEAKIAIGRCGCPPGNKTCQPIPQHSDKKPIARSHPIKCAIPPSCAIVFEIIVKKNIGQKTSVSRSPARCVQFRDGLQVADSGISNAAVHHFRTGSPSN